MDVKTFGNTSVNADNVTHATLKVRAQPAGAPFDDNALRLHFVGGTTLDLFGTDADAARAEFARPSQASPAAKPAVVAPAAPAAPATPAK